MKLVTLFEDYDSALTHSRLLAKVQKVPSLVVALKGKPERYAVIVHDYRMAANAILN